MEQLIYTISNDELQQTIIDTNAMIKNCEPEAGHVPQMTRV